MARGHLGSPLRVSVPGPAQTPNSHRTPKATFEETPKGGAWSVELFQVNDLGHSDSESRLENGLTTCHCALHRLTELFLHCLKQVMETRFGILVEAFRGQFADMHI